MIVLITGGSAFAFLLPLVVCNYYKLVQNATALIRVIMRMIILFGMGSAGVMKRAGNLFEAYLLVVVMMRNNGMCKQYKYCQNQERKS